jgi:hypothetical protein
MLSVSLFALLVTALVGVWVYGEEASRVSGNRVRAAFLAEEGIEALRSMRDGSFASLTAGSHGLSAGTTWSFSGSSDGTDIFNRTVAVDATSFQSRVATSTITWQQGPGRFGGLDVVAILTNWIRSWENPLVVGSLNLSGSADGWRVAVSGDYAYAVRDTGPPDFHVINITDLSSPVHVASMNLNDDVEDIEVVGNYAFIASGVNTQELQVIDISNPSAPTLAGSANASGSDDAISISISGTRAYLTRGGAPNFVIVDIATPTAPTILGSMNLASTPRATIALGNYVYVASENNSQELQVVNVTNPATPSLVASLNLSGGADGSAISGFGTTVLLGREGGSAIVSIDVSTPTAPVVLDTLSFGGGAVNDLALGYTNTHLFVATSHSSGEFKVIDIFDPSDMSLVGSENTGQSLYGVAYDEERDRAFGMHGVNAQEFIIFASQP